MTEMLAPLVAAKSTLDNAVAHLLSLQHEDGWWKGNLQTNVTMDAEDLLLRQFLGIRTEQETQASARWIRSQQAEDGSWNTYHGGPSDLSTTIEAYVALRLAGDLPDAPHMRAAREFVLSRGGIERSRVFTRVWLALFGQWRWRDLPSIPPELILLPPWLPLNVYDFSCWARQTIVPLTIVRTLQPVRELGFGVSELRTGLPPSKPPKWLSRAGLLHRLDRILKLYERRPARRLRRHSIRLATEWILARQEADGSWGGIQPPWVYSLMALRLLGYPMDHPAVRAGLAGLEGFTVRETGPDGPIRWLEACQSPVWDTALAVVALRDAGVPSAQDALRRAERWLLREEITVPGDWSVRRPGLAPGGWAFEFANDGYPDTDDAAEVILALLRTNGSPDVAGAVDRGVKWLIGMQSTGGGWGAFDVDNTSRLASQLPFCDFGEVTDPPSADVTAHIVEAMCAWGLADSPAVRTGVAYLRREQEPGGSWFGRWGVNHVYGTGAAVPALVAAGVTTDDPAIRRAVRWLEQVQNGDGGWGEDIRSYADPAWIGRGPSTASQTAWALLALHAAGETGSPMVQGGVAWLSEHQRQDGTWDEPQFTGTGFPTDFSINYHLYRLVFPVSALGRIVGTAGE